MSIFSVLMEVKDIPFDNYHFEEENDIVLNKLVIYMEDTSDVIHKFKNDDIFIMFSCITIKLTTYDRGHSIEGCIHNNQYIVHIEYKQIHSVDTGERKNHFYKLKYYKYSVEPKYFSSLNDYEEINLSGATFGSLLPRHTKSASNLAGKITN